MYEFEKKKLENYIGTALYNSLKSYKCFIAGGTITSLFCNRDINDIDIYFRSQNDVIDFLTESWNNKDWVVAHTKKATLIQYGDIQIQLIHFNYFKTAQEIFNTFDFTVCMGVFDFEIEEFVLHNDFLKHNAQRMLQFNINTAFPIVSALRVQKYEQKGYHISKPEYIRILLACMGLKITSYDELKEQMGGMYGINYDKLFKKDEEFSLKNAMKQLENLCLDEDYFKKPTSIQFDDVQDLIDNITNEKRKIVRLNNTYYRIDKDNNIIKPIHNKVLYQDAIEIDANEFIKNKKFYKFVQKVNDKYFSYYDSNYEWKIGEINVPKSRNSYSYSEPCLYCGELNEIVGFSYSDKKDKALLELEIGLEDYIEGYGNGIEIKKCKALREVPSDEYKHLLE